MFLLLNISGGGRVRTLGPPQLRPWELNTQLLITFVCPITINNIYYFDWRPSPYLKKNSIKHKRNFQNTDRCWKRTKQQSILSRSGIRLKKKKIKPQILRIHPVVELAQDKLRDVLQFRFPDIITFFTPCVPIIFFFYCSYKVYYLSPWL
jgi:hypothetical protein